MAKHEVGVRPLHDRILVRRTAEEEKTAGGLFIPDSAKEKPQKATKLNKTKEQAENFIGIPGIKVHLTSKKFLRTVATCQNN